MLHNFLHLYLVLTIENFVEISRYRRLTKVPLESQGSELIFSPRVGNL
jgi:hypothetical protein